MNGDDAFLERPVIVIGAPRSGTTWIGQVLSRHPEVAYLDEPRLTWRHGNDGKSDMLSADDARADVKAAIRRAFAERVRAQNRTRLVEKTPSNSLRPAFVDAVFPDCLFVHVLRHPYDAVLSTLSYWTRHSRGVPLRRARRRLREIDLLRLPYYVREVARRVGFPRPKGRGPGLWGPRLPGLAEMVRDLDLLDVCSLQWRMCVETTCMFGRSLPPGRYLEVRLEAMTAGTVDDILNFTALRPEPALHAFFSRRFDAAVTGGRSASAEPEALRRIDRWVEPTLRWLDW
jgi:hypothetical protein